MILNIIFTIVLICFVWGIVKGLVGNILSYILELVITAFIGAFLGWLIGCWYIGALAGAVYVLYCWIFRKYNRLLGWWICH